MISHLAAYFLWAGVCFLKAEASMCRSNLLVDDFSQFNSKTNSLGYKASDDGSMVSIHSSGNTIAFVPGNRSYFYEMLPCTDAVESGYSAISFKMRAPRGASIALEIQTMTSCMEQTYKSTWHYVRDFTGDPEKVVVPLSAFQGVHDNALVGINWGTWDEYMDRAFAWELADVQLTCSRNPPPNSSSAAVGLVSGGV
ncbi:uncharacterized protein GGS25DRAFT_520238 [Hypoxylon fragiforme]|uniref:uncharacterized protein n=1 Tax=Hypoxylon fragiforme TaxID=63214 RepID=UPI0020C66672|nr:uncharacterized protein GGS25DRAFT_520238 [Hypoxylon fragiforme]KAI2609444.1 hypothetical protein GGS25DRAFT_520238 [Hypoxylon fragiforme]